MDIFFQKNKLINFGSEILLQNGRWGVTDTKNLFFKAEKYEILTILHFFHDHYNLNIQK